MRRILGHLAPVNVRVLAIGDQAVCQLRHAPGEIGMEIEHSKDGQPGGPRQGAQPFQHLALHIEERLRNHGSMQDQINRIDSGLQRGPGVLLKAGPEPLDDGILDQGGRLCPVVHGGDHIPAKLGRAFQHPAQGRAIARTGQHLGTLKDLKGLQGRSAFERGVGLVKQSGDQDAWHVFK